MCTNQDLACVDYSPDIILWLFRMQVPSSPPPLMAPIARRLSVSGSVTGTDDPGLMSCVLPDDMLCEILSDRFMVSCRFSFFKILTIHSRLSLCLNILWHARTCTMYSYIIVINSCYGLPCVACQYHRTLLVAERLPSWRCVRRPGHAVCSEPLPRVSLYPQGPQQPEVPLHGDAQERLPPAQGEGERGGGNSWSVNMNSNIHT